MNTVMLKVNDLIDFEAQPFKVIDDESMDELTESIKAVGVLVPIIVREIGNGKYEIISGHRRKYACEKAGIEEIPATVKNLSDDEAAIMLVDSNLQRENLLPSERAYAYKLKLEALKHQGKATCRHDVDKLKSADIVGEAFGESGRQVQRYIRLTELIYQLLDKVDIRRIPVAAGAEVSYLDFVAQLQLNDWLDFEMCGLTTQQATQIKKSFQEGEFSEVLLEAMLHNKEKVRKPKFDYERLRSYFPPEYSIKECEDVLWKLLEEWSGKQQKSLKSQTIDVYM